MGKSKIVAIWIIALVILAGVTTASFLLGKNLGTSGTDLSHESDGVIFFEIDSFSLKNNSVLLKGKKVGAFLNWTPNGDYEFSDNAAAEFDVPNEVKMEYVNAIIDPGTREISTLTVGKCFSEINKGTSPDVALVYLHIQNGKVVRIQQAIEIVY